MKKNNERQSKTKREKENKYSSAKLALCPSAAGGVGEQQHQEKQ